MHDETKNQRDIIITQNDEQTMISVDYCIADLIVKLNKKGFYTEYCCSGHEEDAFMSMYIKFKPTMDSKHESLIRTFINNHVDELYVEDDYEIGTPPLEISSNYIQLVDPTQEELTMAKMIVFRDRCNDEELIKQYISHSIIIRTQHSRDYIKQPDEFKEFDTLEEWENFIATNKVKSILGIKKLESFMDNVEIIGCDLSLED